jgi:hypothetical protein
MLTKHLRVALVAGLVATASALVLASASSAAQDRWTDSFDYGSSSPCDNFANLWTGHAEERGMTTYDKSGSPVKDIVHQTGTELDWRSDTLASFSVSWSFTLVYDYARDTTTLNGRVVMATSPGAGVLIQDVGKVIFTPDGPPVVHGPHDVLAGGNQAYCDALEEIGA